MARWSSPVLPRPTVVRLGTPRRVQVGDTVKARVRMMGATGKHHPMMGPGAGNPDMVVPKASDNPSHTLCSGAMVGVGVTRRGEEDTDKTTGIITVEVAMVEDTTTTSRVGEDLDTRYERYYE